MKIKEKLDLANKETVFEYYSRIVPEFKEYKKITKEKMKEDILKEYEDYNNIIEICTTKELKYLKLLLENNNYLSYESKYEWEIKTLEEKLLITTKIDNSTIPEELYNSVSKALSKVKWKNHQKTDKLNEIIIGICKVHGEISKQDLIKLTQQLIKINEDTLIKQTTENKLFNYYVQITKKCLPQKENQELVFIYRNSYDLIEKLEQTKQLKHHTQLSNLNEKDYISIFYNDLNLNNQTIYKTYKKLKKLKHHKFLIDRIIINTFLNEDRSSIYYFVKEMYSTKIKNVDEFIKLLDNAMDEMPSAVLNGFSPNELKKL